MIKSKIMINNIPAILWGEDTSKLFIAVHGNMSSKEDTLISILAELLIPQGYQVLSFDLPEHGERKNEAIKCKVETCVSELSAVMQYAKNHAQEISLFACSMGAYFSLLAYKKDSIKQSLFISPVVDMKRLIENMMKAFIIDEKDLKEKQEITTPIGQTLYWDYYCYVRENPIVFWKIPTAILYGEKDELCEAEVILSFVQNFKCKLEVAENTQHYFHTSEQLATYKKWLESNLL